MHPGDKVLPGEGPEIAAREERAAFIPARAGGLVPGEGLLLARELQSYLDRRKYQ